MTNEVYHLGNGKTQAVMVLICEQS